MLLWLVEFNSFTTNSKATANIISSRPKRLTKPPTDSWNHFEHFRRLFLHHHLPMVVYTNGLSLFGHDSIGR